MGRDPTAQIEECLLLVIPGARHREPVLRRIIDEVAPVVVLVPSSLRDYGSWAIPFAKGWIEWEDGADGNHEAAWLALSAWFESKGQPKILGCTTYDEWGLETCAYLCAPERLNLPGITTEAIDCIRDKVRFREVCMAAGVPSPQVCRVHTLDDLKSELSGRTWAFPLILKPACGAGSYYVRKVRSEEDLLSSFTQLQELSLLEKKLRLQDLSHGWCVEEFFEGAEVDVDGWAMNSEVGWMSVSDNKPVGADCCETGGIYPSQLPRHCVQALEQLTRDVLRVFKNLHLVFHFEALVNVKTGQVMPIELNCRVGGAECPTCVEAISGVYLPVDAADIAMGRRPRAWPSPKWEVAASTNVQKPNKGVVLACGGSEDLFNDAAYLGSQFYKTVGSPYTPSSGSLSTLCWLAAGGATAQEAEANLARCVSKCLLEVGDDVDIGNK